MQHITTFLWFNGKAEEAARFYVSVFEGASIDSVTPLGPDGGMALVNFTLRGAPFMALDGGPMYEFSQATSFMVHCETQDEIDHFWDKLSEGGTQQMCGWLIDRFGVTWQVVPNILGKLMSDPAKAGAVMQVFSQCKKFVIADLQAAYDSA